MAIPILQMKQSFPRSFRARLHPVPWSRPQGQRLARDAFQTCNAEGLECWAAAGEVGIEGDTQFKPGVGEWTLGTAWPAAPASSSPARADVLSLGWPGVCIWVLL